MFDSCYFNTPVQDMSATIPCCSLFNELGLLPCSDPHFSCPFAIHSDEVRSIVVRNVLIRAFPNLKL